MTDQVRFIERDDPDARITIRDWPWQITSRLTKIVLIRHGESTANAGEATDDPSTIPLTPKGQEQARLAAETVDSPTVIITSPFARAMATAAPLRERHSDVSYGVWPIQEFTYLTPSKCAGTTAEQRKGWVDEYWHQADPLYVDGPGAESFAGFLGRVTHFIAQLRQMPAKSRAAIYGHGQFFSAARWLVEVGQESVDQVLASVPNPMQSFKEFDCKNHLENGSAWSFYQGLNGVWLYD